MKNELPCGKTLRYLLHVCTAVLAEPTDTAGEQGAAGGRAHSAVGRSRAAHPVCPRSPAQPHTGHQLQKSATSPRTTHTQERVRRRFAKSFSFPASRTRSEILSTRGSGWSGTPGRGPTVHAGRRGAPGAVLPRAAPDRLHTVLSTRRRGTASGPHTLAVRSARVPTRACGRVPRPA